MESRTMLYLLPALFMAAAVGCSQPAAAPSARMAPSEPAPDGVLSFGSISLNPAQEFEVFRPFANRVAERLHDVGIGRVRVEVAGSLSEMVEMLRTGQVDVFIDSPFPAAFVWTHGDMTPILRRWKRGTDTYRSVVFTRNDNGIGTVGDLAGKIIAFGEPFSTTGFLLPKAALASAGLRLIHYADPAASVPDTRVGYVFSNDAENTIFWVLKEKVTAGAINADYYQDLAGELIDELRILHTTRAVPRNVVCVRNDLDPGVKEAFQKVLLEMHLDDEGRAALLDFQGTSRFDLFPGGVEEDLSEIKQLLVHVEEDLGQ